jgi:hypothetical protein
MKLYPKRSKRFTISFARLFHSKSNKTAKKTTTETDVFQHSDGGEARPQCTFSPSALG